MKSFYKHSIAPLFVVSLMLLGITLSSDALAAATPSLGSAQSYAILSSTFTNTSAGTTITGDIGFTTGPAVLPLGVHANYGLGAPYATAGADQGSALAALNSELCTFSFPAGAINLSTDITHGPIGVYTPGVYCVTGAMDVGGPLTLSGNGTYIFRSTGALTSTAGAVITLNSASACDVFWTPIQATTLAANTTFAGIVIDNAGITVGANTTWTGMALAFGGTVTTDTDSITACAAHSSSGGGGSETANITVVKTMINDNGGKKTVSDFKLFVNDTPVVSGETNSYQAPSGVYTISETPDSNYTQMFSGDCDAKGTLGLYPGNDYVCVLTNDDIGAPVIIPPVPPLIDVVKVPNPLSLPAGPGPVTYTYTLRNIGTVPVTNITMVGDTCSPITLTSGDTNSDDKLDVSETWIYNCSTTLSKTHTNTVVATGWANGLTATDIASATVVVGAPAMPPPEVPPLIHVTKVPSPLTLLAGGGWVTYSEKITNPGTVALSNVHLTDDKCSPMEYVFGDKDDDSKLDTTEKWIYICRTKLTKTTTNTATATGEANGFTAKDVAIAIVPVATAVPKLPNTGVAPEENFLAWSAAAAGISAVSLFLYFFRKKQIS